METYSRDEIMGNPLEWVDPTATEDRRILIGSHFVIDNPNLIQI